MRDHRGRTALAPTISFPRVLFIATRTSTSFPTSASTLTSSHILSIHSTSYQTDRGAVLIKQQDHLRLKPECPDRVSPAHSRITIWQPRQGSPISISGGESHSHRLAWAVIHIPYQIVSTLTLRGAPSTPCLVSLLCVGSCIPDLHGRRLGIATLRLVLGWVTRGRRHCQ